MSTAATATEVQAIVNEFFTVPEVDRVDVAVHGDLVMVWTGITKWAQQVRYRVYDVEKRLYRKYPKLMFEFNVVESDDAECPDVVTFRRPK